MRRLGGGAAADLAPPPPPAAAIAAVAAPAVAVIVAAAEPPSPSAAADGSLVGPAVLPGPTRCLVLRNMFSTPAEAELADGPDWPSVLEQDVRDACEQALAPPDHVFVDARGESGGGGGNGEGAGGAPSSMGGWVYARLPTAEAAAQAQRMLHGRFYAGRVVAAAFQDEADYARRFGL
jgi:RNA-binding protein 23/39